MSCANIPLFPLPLVLFPGAYLPLRIFEQRYIDMVRECTVNESCFGICLVDQTENEAQSSFHDFVGTLARIFDFSTLDDGLLGISVRGEQKFRVQNTRIRDNGLLMAEVTIAPEDSPLEVPEQYSVLSLIAGRLMEQLQENYPAFQPILLQDSNWIGYRLAELLPLENREKQVLLEISDPLERLQMLLDLLPRFQEPGSS